MDVGTHLCVDLELLRKLLIGHLAPADRDPVAANGWSHSEVPGSGFLKDTLLYNRDQMKESKGA